MKKMQQKGERRVSAALRLALVVVLLFIQLAAIGLLSHFVTNNTAIIYGAFRIAGLIGAILIYNRSGGESYKVFWIIFILFMPVAGLILYALWGVEAQQRRLRRRKTDAFPGTPDGAENLAALQEKMPQWGRLAHYLTGQDFELYGETDVRYFAEGAAFLENLIARAATAERYIFLEYFILAEGKLWDRLSAVLTERAAHGVEVKILFDDFGNIKRFRGETIEALREKGVEVLVFNPVHQYVNRLYFNYRDHRKIAVIDGETAYTGGINIADEYANLFVRFGHWKDSGIRMDGAGSWGFCRAFSGMWTLTGGTFDHAADWYRPQKTAPTHGYIQPFTDGPFNAPDNPAEDVYLQMIANARRSLWLATPYFIPDANILRTLCVAGDGGVDVRLLLPGLPDHLTADCIAGSYFDELMAHGVKIYRYIPGILHEKVVLADGETAVVGSVNVDYRSFALHYECGAVLYGMPVIGEMQRDLEEVIAQSRTVTPEEWQRRPWYRRASEKLLRLFGIWM